MYFLFAADIVFMGETRRLKDYTHIPPKKKMNMNTNKTKVISNSHIVPAPARDTGRIIA
jgi:hypothetical protein